MHYDDKKGNAMENKKFSFYTNISVQDTLNDLQAHETGLTEAEVNQRLAQYGTNEIKETDVTWFQILTNQLLSPFMCIFFIIGVAYLCTNQLFEAALIFGMIVINVGIGFYQE